MFDLFSKASFNSLFPGTEAACKENKFKVKERLQLTLFSDHVVSELTLDLNVQNKTDPT